MGTRNFMFRYALWDDSQSARTAGDSATDESQPLVQTCCRGLLDASIIVIASPSPGPKTVLSLLSVGSLSARVCLLERSGCQNYRLTCHFWVWGSEPGPSVTNSHPAPRSGASSASILPACLNRPSPCAKALLRGSAEIWMEPTYSSLRALRCPGCGA